MLEKVQEIWLELYLGFENVISVFILEPTNTGYSGVIDAYVRFCRLLDDVLEFGFPGPFPRISHQVRRPGDAIMQFKDNHTSFSSKQERQPE